MITIDSYPPLRKDPDTAFSPLAALRPALLFVPAYASKALSQLSLLIREFPIISLLLYLSVSQVLSVSAITREEAKNSLV